MKIGMSECSCNIVNHRCPYCHGTFAPSMPKLIEYCVTKPDTTVVVA